MNNLIYWAPFISNVGTIRSCMNSAIAYKKFSDNKNSVKIINVFGEWNAYNSILKENGIEVVDFYPNLAKYIPSSGYIKSRLAYIFIFLLAFFPLLNFLKKEKNSYFIAHLITSLPLFLILCFNFKSKMILRISGYPKLNFLRKFLWKIVNKKLFMVTCPTVELKEKLHNLNFLDDSKLKFLPDAIINIKDFYINREKIVNLPTKKKFILSVGRLTKQKNYEYLIYEIKDFLIKNKNYDYIIIGDGEDKKYLEKLVTNLNLKERIFLLGHQSNPFFYMKKASFLIMSSLWEEVGFVLVEAALSNLVVISSDCPNGPKEFLSNGDAGFLYKSNKKGELKRILDDIINEDTLKKTILAKRNSLSYTRFRHYISLKKLLSI